MKLIDFEDETAGANENKSVNASQARLDIEAFSMLAVINHTRIRAVTACSWSFRAADFASRIVSTNLHYAVRTGTNTIPKDQAVQS